MHDPLKCKTNLIHRILRRYVVEDSTARWNEDYSTVCFTKVNSLLIQTCTCMRSKHQSQNSKPDCSSTNISKVGIPAIGTKKCYLINEK